MLFKGQKIRTYIDKKMKIFSFLKAQSNQYVCTDNSGVEIILDPSQCRIGTYNFHHPIVVRENKVGLKYNKDIFYTTNHALKRALSRSLIGSKYHYAHLIHKILKTGKRYSKADLAAIIEISKYSKTAFFIVNEPLDSVLVIADMTILTIYSLSGSRIKKDIIQRKIRNEL